MIIIRWEARTQLRLPIRTLPNRQGLRSNFAVVPTLSSESPRKQPKRTVVRLAEEEDVATPKGLSIALEAIDGPCTMLWGSIPCIGGCPWQKINRKRPGGEARLRKHFATIKEIWEAFVKVAQVVVRAGASVAFEGPKTVPTGSGHE
jgi:hypothetical protein